jgi:retinol dehydrogenase-14
MRMDGKIVLITGANSGVGFATARKTGGTWRFGRHGLPRFTPWQRRKEEIARVATDSPPALLLCDLSSQASIREVASEVHARFSRIDVLLNNAAAIFAHRQVTEDGIEKTFAINHLAPFLLTSLLLDLVRVTPAGRILTVASESHSGALEFDNLQGERHYNFFGAYNRSKLANILFTYELAHRLKGTGTTVNCLSPGPTVTPFGNNLTGLPALFPMLMKKIPFLFHSPEKGAETSIYLASAQEVAGVSGRFFLRCHESRSKKITYHAEVASRLWKVSEELCPRSP